MALHWSILEPHHASISRWWIHDWRETNKLNKLEQQNDITVFNTVLLSQHFCYLKGISHSISNRKFCGFSFIIAMVHQNSPTVEFLQEKIEGNLTRANTEPSVDFRRANTEPSVDFRKTNTEPSVNFRSANRETYWKWNVNLSKRVGKDRVFLGLAWLLLGISLGLRLWEIPRSSPASPWKTPSFPPLLLRLTQYKSFNTMHYQCLNIIILKGPPAQC